MGLAGSGPRPAPIRGVRVRMDANEPSARPHAHHIKPTRGDRPPNRLLTHIVHLCHVPHRQEWGRFAQLAGHSGAGVRILWKMKRKLALRCLQAVAPMPVRLQLRGLAQGHLVTKRSGGLPTCPRHAAIGHMPAKCINLTARVVAIFIRQGSHVNVPSGCSPWRYRYPWQPSPGKPGSHSAGSSTARP